MPDLSRPAQAGALRAQLCALACLSWGVLAHAGCADAPLSDAGASQGDGSAALAEEREQEQAVAVASSALLLEDTTVAPLAAYSVALRLRSAYEGAALRVRRASDNTTLDVGFTIQHRVNAGAISTFCGASDCFVVAVYDQSMNGLHLGQLDTAKQIKLYNGATQAFVGGSTTPVLKTVPGKTVERLGSLTLGSNPALTVAYAGRYVGPELGVGAEVRPIRVTSTDPLLAARGLSLGYGAADEGASIQAFGGTGDVGWTVANINQQHRGVLLHSSGTNADTSRFRFNGSELTASTVSATGPFQLGTTQSIVLGVDAAATGAQAETSTVLIWNQVLGAGDLAKVEAALNPGFPVPAGAGVIGGILGGSLVEYWDSRAGTVLVDGRVSSWVGQVRGTTASAVEAHLRPQLAADGSAFLGQPVIQCSGNQSLEGRLGAPLLPAGSYPYMAFVGRLRALKPTSLGQASLVGFDHSYAASASADAGISVKVDPAGHWNAYLRWTGLSPDETSPVQQDTALHFFEYEQKADTGLRLYMDGVLIAKYEPGLFPLSYEQGATVAALDSVSFCSRLAPLDLSLAQVVLATQVPTPAQRLALWDHARAQFGVRYCGDGVLQSGESCDDGNRTHSDACGNDCTLRSPINDQVEGIFGGGLVEWWDSRVGQTLVSGGVDAWIGRKRGIIVHPLGGRPSLGNDQSYFNGNPVVQTNASQLASLYASVEDDLLPSGSRPYIAVVHRYRTIPNDPHMRRIVNFASFAPDAGQIALAHDGHNGTGATYMARWPQSSSQWSMGHGNMTDVPVLSEAWVDGSGLHYAQNGVEYPIDGNASTGLFKAFKRLSFGMEPGMSQYSDTSFAQVVLASPAPSAAQRAQYLQYARQEWGIVLCSDTQVGPGEQCDDGNLVSNDGCSSTCQSEGGGACASVTTCTGGDGCCPLSCSSANDSDCAAAGACSPSNPCPNGEAGCTTSADCEPGLACSFGIGSVFGHTTSGGVCWDASSCATLYPYAEACGNTNAYCGTCCVPYCVQAGQPDGCGGTCAACVTGADSDGDGLDDCSERADGNGWTDPYLFNGASAQRGLSCDGAASCGAIDTQSEIHGCFEPNDSAALRAGWSFSANAGDICAPAIGYEPQWSECGTDFGVHYAAAIRLEQSGVWCFSATGSTASQCGSVTFDDRTATSPSGVLCSAAIPAGTYPLAWFFHTANTTNNSFSLRYCYGGSASCTPSAVVPNSMLRMPHDREERLCDPGGPCTELCPCDVGQACDPGVAPCRPGLECRTGLSSRFGFSTPAPVCWDPGCDDYQSAAFECGTTSSHCGTCPACSPSCAGKSCGGDACWGSCGTCSAGQQGCRSSVDCASGLVCGSDNGAHFGAAATADACWSPACENLEQAAELCGSTSSTCGTCAACVPDCSGRTCGDNGCGGTCGTCAGGSSCDAMSGTCSQPPLAPNVVYSNPMQVTTAPVGKLPGKFAVSMTGDATYEIPLEVPPGRGGIEPALALSYDSSRGNGYLGMGWGVEGLSVITRCNKTLALDGVALAPRGGEQRGAEVDAFCLDGRRLVNVGGNLFASPAIAVYRTAEDQFAKIEGEFQVTQPTLEDYRFVPVRFRVLAKDGRIFEYEDTLRSGSAANPNAMVWSLTRITDRTGQNEVRIDYTRQLAVFSEAPAREYYPRAITYGPSQAPITIGFRYSFDEQPFESRPDPLSTYQHGTDVQVNSLLRRIVVNVHGQEVRRYTLAYETPEDTRGLVSHSRLASVQDCTGAGVCKPPTTFEYNVVTHPWEPRFESTRELAPESLGLDLGYTPWRTVTRPVPVAPLYVLDVNGDGLDDVLFPSFHEETICFLGQGRRQHGAWNLSVSNIEGDRATESTVRTHGVVDSQLTYYEEEVCWGSLEIGQSSAGVAAVIDIDGDGRDELLELDWEDPGTPRNYTFIRYNSATETLQRERLSVLQPQNGHQYVMDADGDRLKDLLVCDEMDGTTTWRLHRHVRSGAGFGPAEVLTVAPGQALASVPCDKNALVLDLENDGPHEIVLAAEAATAGALPRSPGIVRVLPNGTLGVTATTIRHAEIPDLRTCVGDGCAEGRGPAILMDANGDALTDVVRCASQKLIVQLSRGDGTFTNDETECPASLVPLAWDADADGRQDLIGSFDGTYRVLYSTPGGARPFTPLASGGTVAIPEGSDPRTIDSNGDGVPGLLYTVYRNTSGQNRLHRVVERVGAYRDRLHTITDGFGAQTKVIYDSLTSPVVYSSTISTPDGSSDCHFPTLCRAPRSRAVRFQMELDVPEQLQSSLPDRAFAYEYAGAGIDALSGNALGFASRTVRRVVPESVGDYREDITVEHVTFDNTTYDEGVKAFPFALKPQTSSVTTLLDGGEHVEEAEYDYELTRPTSLSYAAFRRATFTQRWTTAGPSTVPSYLGALNELVTDHDVYNNVLRSESTLDNGDQTVITRTYAHQSNSALENAWLIALPAVETETRTSAAGLTTARAIARAYYPTGLLQRTIAQAGDAAHQLTTTYGRDAFGNVTSVSAVGPTGSPRNTTIQFDARGEYPIAMTNAKNQVTKLAYDRVSGQLRFLEDANGLKSQWAYDGFNRLGAFVGPDNVATTTTYSRGSDLLPMEIETATAGGARDRIGFDNRGRPSVHTKIGELDKQLRRVMRYDRDGDVYLVSRFTDASFTPIDDVYYTHDNLGRVTSSLLMGGGEETIHCYDIRKHCVEDARGYTSCTIHDILGRPLAVLDPVLGSCDVVRAAATTSQPGTRYTYGPAGNVHTITDRAGNVTTALTDNFGRINRLIDPDLGTREGSYNAFGELISARKADNEQTRFEYDLLGRRTRRIDVNMNGPGQDGITDWIWDGGAVREPALGELIGQLTETVSSDSVQERLRYNTTTGAFNRIDQTISGATLTLSLTHDNFGRISSIAYPGGFTATQVFDGHGHLTEVRNAANNASIWRLEETDVSGRTQEEVFGNGAVTTRSYTPNGQLEVITSALPGDDPFQELEYVYDSSLNVEQRIDWMRNFAEVYAYDAQSRLISDTGTSTTFSYDAEGNISSGTESYNEPQPHALSSDGTFTYGYDLNGRRIRKQQGSSFMQRTRYTPFEQVREVWNESATGVKQVSAAYLYNADASRVQKRTTNTSNNTTTRYIGGIYERRVPTSGSTQHICYINNGDRTVAQVTRTGSTNSLRFLHEDAIGSIRYATNNAGTVTELDYDAFGRSRHPNLSGSPPPANTIGLMLGFTEQEEQREHGLIHMGARLYDPRTRQFTTPDPMQPMPSGIGLNRYAYVFQNPLRWTDPSGYTPEGGVPEGELPPITVIGVREPTQPPPPTAGAAWSTPAGETGGQSLVTGGPLAGTYHVAAEAARSVDTIAPLDASSTYYVDRATGKERPYPWIKHDATPMDWLLWGGHFALHVIPFLPPGEAIALQAGMRTVSSVGAMARARYVPSPKHGATAYGTAKGVASRAPSNGQAVLDTALDIGNGARRIGVDGAANEFVVFDQTNNIAARFPEFHAHVRTWAELSSEMRALLIREGYASRGGKILVP